MKYLLWALVIYLAWRWYSTAKAQREAAAEVRDEPDDGSERMVRCAQCGIHLPQSESIAGAGAERFCSAEHRALRQGG